MPRVVLVLVRGGAADEDVFAMALAMGRPDGAHFVMLHTRPDVVRDIAALAGADGGGMGAGIDTMMNQMEDDADTREQGAEHAWRAFCARNGIAIADQPSNGQPSTGQPSTAQHTGEGSSAGQPMTAEWVSEIGAEDQWLAVHGRTVDLIVVGRGEADQETDFALMEAALMDTGKPVVIAPRGMAGMAVPKGMPGGMPQGIVGIAWRDTPEAAGAVHAALPWLRAATDVIIFAVTEDEEETDKSPLRLARMLRWHNPRVAVRVVLREGRSAATVLLEAAAKAGCGLLVMGGYGHGALRQAMFGGFTRDVLEAAPMPVLMAH